MARPKTHKFSLRTKGLSDEEAAQLFYVLSSAGYAAVRADNHRYDTGSNVPLKVLRSAFPDADWTQCTAAERVELVK